jgi:hypothetical protein
MQGKFKLESAGQLLIKAARGPKRKVKVRMDRRHIHSAGLHALKWSDIEVWHLRGSYKKGLPYANAEELLGF